MMDFKVKEGAENMLVTGTVGSCILMKEITYSLKLARNVPVVNTIQGQTHHTTKHAAGKVTSLVFAIV